MLGQGKVTQPDGLVRVLFNVLNAPTGGLEPVDFTYEEFDHERTASQFDFSIHIDTEFAHRIHLEYSTELYAGVTAERMLENFIAVIEQVLAEPERPLSTYSVVAPAQLALLRKNWNATQLPLRRSLCCIGTWARRGRRCATGLPRWTHRAGSCATGNSMHSPTCWPVRCARVASPAATGSGCACRATRACWWPSSPF